MSCGNLGKVSMGTTIDIRDGDNVRALGKRLEDVGSGRRTGRERQREFRMLESGYGILKIVPVRVRASYILIAANWFTYTCLCEGS